MTVTTSLAETPEITRRDRRVAVALTARALFELTPVDMNDADARRRAENAATECVDAFLVELGTKVVAE